MQNTILALRPTDPNIRLRPARLSDADTLSFRCWPNRPFASVYDLVCRAARSADDGRGLGVVALDMAGEVQGFGQMSVWPTCAEISDLVVTEARRGQGFGTAIVQVLAQEARRLGAPAVEIGAALTNPRAAALYRRLGFEDSHTVMLNLGKGKEPVLFLRLELGPPDTGTGDLAALFGG